MAGDNQTEFGERIGVRQADVSEMETGKAPIPPEALDSIVGVLRALPPERQAADFESARILNEVIRGLVSQQAAILEVLEDRGEDAPAGAD